MEEFISSEFFKWGVMPLIIFAARIIDVSLGTTRIIMVSKGHKQLAMIIGFFEVILWLVVAGQVLQSVDNIVYILAYAGGFAAGSYIGITLDEKMAMGKISVRMITSKDPAPFLELLTENGFGYTYFDAKGSRGPAYLVYSIMHRKKYKEYEILAKQFDPKSFVAVEDTKAVREGIFHPVDEQKLNIRKLSPTRKSK